MKVFRQLRGLLFRHRLEREMAEEMQHHLKAQAETNRLAGMDATEANFAARRQFGGVEQTKEWCREQRSFAWLEQFRQDCGYALRQLRRNPGFAATAIGVLALGIGATTAVFGVVEAMVLRPLQYEDAGRLVRLFEAPEPGGQNSVSPGVYRDWVEGSRSFEAIGYYRAASINIGGTGAPERIDGLRMSANSLEIMRATPLVGRIFTADEDQAGHDKVVVLTHQLWQRRFGGDQAVVGSTVLLDDEPHTVIGVLAPGFLPIERQEFVLPFVFEAGWRDARGNQRLRVMARLKPGVTVEQAQEDLAGIADRNRSLYPDWKKNWSATIVPLQQDLSREIRPASLVLLGAVCLVLLVACANVANLLLARASARHREISVRAALGASWGRILRQLLTESVLLSSIGGGLGMLLAAGLLGGLRQILGGLGYARAHEIGLAPGVLGLALSVTLLTGLFFGLAPAWQAARPGVGRGLKDSARGSTGHGNRLRDSLIVGEMALALMLLVGAGLFLRSFFRLTGEPVGFNPKGALTLQLSLSRQKYPDLARRIAFYGLVAERVAALPGVEAAGLNNLTPLRAGYSNAFFRVPGRPDQPESGYLSDYDFCTADYFRAMGIPVLRGRAFTASEVAAGAPIAVISAAASREFFPGVDPIGRQITRENGQLWEVVGIVGDVQNRTFGAPAVPMVYRTQSSSDAWSTAGLVVRTRIQPEAVAASVIQAIREIDPALPVAGVMPLSDLVADSVAERRLTIIVLTAFAASALLLAAVGLYGVIAYLVSQRTREFGIRLSLGADPAAIVRLVLGHGLRLVLAGLALGVVGALGLTRLIASLLYRVEPTDPATFAAVAFLLFLTALAASWLPARRAARTDPMVALRSE